MRARFGPLRAPCLPGHAHRARRGACVRSSRLSSSALPRAPPARPLSCGTFRPEPATRQFDGSFAATPSSRDRFARQAPSEPLPGLPPPSLSPGVVHRLSGQVSGVIYLSLQLRTPTRPKYYILATHSINLLLGPCYKTGCSRSRSSDGTSRRLFRAFSLRSRASFLLSLAVLLLYRPIPLFSLRWIAPPFTVRAHAQLLSAPRVVRGFHPLWPERRLSSRSPLHTPSGSPRAPPLSLAATPGIRLRFFSSAY